MKALHLEDFRGTADEPVEAWLATIPQEVERQAGLGGHTWTAEELYYGVTAHVKVRTSTWLTTLTSSMRREDKTLEFLVRKLRKKYGRRDNVFKVQQRLVERVQKPGERLSDYADVLTNIGFGHRVPVIKFPQKSFVNGINNQTAVMQMKGHNPKTLEDAVQYAEDTCGEYGEGFRVTDW
ncbi:putative Polyprotein [Phytophthora megakarya]|uniref:Putative Polyprotein n=1 Tax=Phytophthora megakarya TaxID=4795 RepID=A0A225UY55_9STRA|nr:putative Polyprotein [Phytophthora megakarya]